MKRRIVLSTQPGRTITSCFCTSLLFFHLSKTVNVPNLRFFRWNKSVSPSVFFSTVTVITYIHFYTLYPPLFLLCSTYHVPFVSFRLSSFLPSVPSPGPSLSAYYKLVSVISRQSAEWDWGEGAREDGRNEAGSERKKSGKEEAVTEEDKHKESDSFKEQDKSDSWKEKEALMKKKLCLRGRRGNLASENSKADVQ